VVGLLGLFDDKWVEKINKLPSKVKGALNHISEKKNEMAHGLPCEVILNEVIAEYKSSKKVIEAVDRIVKF
jgi:hypothetical protein